MKFANDPDDIFVTIAVTDGELALLEASAWNDDRFDNLAAKVKAARAGKPEEWMDYLIAGGPVNE